MVSLRWALWLASWVQIPVHCVILGKLLNISEPRLLPVEMKGSSREWGGSCGSCCRPLLLCNGLFTPTTEEGQW